MLNQKIRATIAQFRQVLPAELSALIEQGAGEISALDFIERARKVGEAAPDFALPNQRGEQKRLADYLARGPLVLTFYRGVWCPYCNLQLKECAPIARRSSNARLGDRCWPGRVRCRSLVNRRQRWQH